MATATDHVAAFSAAEIFAALAAPIDPSEVRTRRGGDGKQLRYITAETCRRRLDQAVGPWGWESKLSPVPGGFICALTVHLPDGLSVTRSAVGGCPAMQGPDGPENSVKGGATDALKRACLEFGIGADLYEDADPGPARPGPAHGVGVGVGKPRDVWGPGRPEQAPPGARPERPGDDRDPTTGARFHGWLKDRERESGEAGLFRHVERWGREQGRPGMFRDWSAAEVREGVAEARRFLGEA